MSKTRTNHRRSFSESVYRSTVEISDSFLYFIFSLPSLNRETSVSSFGQFKMILERESCGMKRKRTIELGYIGFFLLVLQAREFTSSDLFLEIDNFQEFLFLEKSIRKFDSANFGNLRIYRNWFFFFRKYRGSIFVEKLD